MNAIRSLTSRKSLPESGRMEERFAWLKTVSVPGAKTCCTKLSLGAQAVLVERVSEGEVFAQMRATGGDENFAA